MGTPLHHGRGASAAAASLFFGTGLGLALAGRPLRGFAWLGAAAMCALLIVLVLVPWFAFVLVAVHVAASVDSYLVARRLEHSLRLDTLGPPALFVTAVMGLIGLRSYVVEAFKIPSSAMYPTLVIGDHIYVTKLPLLWRAPQRGEMIVFRYPCDDARDYIKRVVALPGETVEVRCDIVYIDGKPVPQTLVAAQTSYMDFEEQTSGWYERSVSRYREQLGTHTHDVFSDVDRPTRERGPQLEGDPRDFPTHGRPAPGCADSELETDISKHVDQVLGTVVETKPDAKACEPQAHYVVPADHVFVLGDNRHNSNDSRVWGAVPLASVKGIVSSIWLSSGYQLELGRIGRVE